MTKITASMVAELRSKTGAGMMDCKKALSETAGDFEKAIDLLRKKGLSAAAKKSGRTAAEGLVIVAGSGVAGAVVEVNAETDFVAKNDAFVNFATKIAELVVGEKPENMEALLALPFPGTGRSVAEEQVHQISTIGESINIRRFERQEANNGIIESYVHGAGKIGVMLALQSDKADNATVQAVARQLAMHIAAAAPQYLRREDVPAEVIDKEKEFMRAKALESGKPEKILDKIISGQIDKYFGEICLLEQAFVIDPDLKINALLEKTAKEVGADINLIDYVRYQLGEGIEKKGCDFATEVAEMTKG
jgi:elongation factor Ts